MANEVSIKFGTLTFDGVTTITSIRETPQISPPISDVPRSDSSIAETAKKKAILLSVEGDVYGADYDTKRANVDTLKAIFFSGLQKFTKDDDRYLMAQIKSPNFDDILIRNLEHWSVTFVAHYPFWLSETLYTDDKNPATSGSGYTINNAGNAITRLKALITAPGGGIADNIQLENTTRGELLKYRGNVAAGDILELDNRVDGDDFDVLNDGVSDKPNYEGDVLSLSPGNNTIKFTGTPGTRIQLFWHAAWH